MEPPLASHNVPLVAATGAPAPPTAPLREDPAFRELCNVLAAKQRLIESLEITIRGQAEYIARLKADVAAIGAQNAALWSAAHGRVVMYDPASVFGRN